MAFCWSLEDATVGDGFARILAAQLRRSLAVIDDEAESPARRIHAVRRRAKRMRGLLRLVRPGFPDYRAVNRRIRDAASALSGTRDAAVLRDTLVELCRWSGHPVPDAAAGPDAQEAEATALSGFRAQLLDLQHDLPDWSIADIDAETLARGMADEYKAGRQTMHHSQQHPDDDVALHEWRKHVKYLSFHLLLLRRVLPDAEIQIEATESLATLLGRHHDLSVLRAALAEGQLGDGLDAGFLRHHARQRQHRLAAHAFRLGSPLFARHAKDLRHGIMTRWQDWQATGQDT